MAKKRNPSVFDKEYAHQQQQWVARRFVKEGLSHGITFALLARAEDLIRLLDLGSSEGRAKFLEDYMDDPEVFRRQVQRYRTGIPRFIEMLKTIEGELDSQGLADINLKTRTVERR
jgi:hypothetical protein